MLIRCIVVRSFCVSWLSISCFLSFWAIRCCCLIVCVNFLRRIVGRFSFGEFVFVRFFCNKRVCFKFGGRRVFCAFFLVGGKGCVLRERLGS